jgi:hypothetical protein
MDKMDFSPVKIQIVRRALTLGSSSKQSKRQMATRAGPSAETHVLGKNKTQKKKNSRALTSMPFYIQSLLIQNCGRNEHRCNM